MCTVENSWHFLEYEFMNESYEYAWDFTFSALKSYLCNTTIGDMNPWYNPLIHTMVFFDNLKSINSDVSISWRIIILYWPSVDLSTWNCYIMIFVKLNSSKKCTLTFAVVIKFLIYTLHYVGDSFLCLSNFIIFPLTILGKNLLYNNIQNLL